MFFKTSFLVFLSQKEQAGKADSVFDFKIFISTNNQKEFTSGDEKTILSTWVGV
jgi:hypothetical protein